MTGQRATLTARVALLDQAVDSLAQAVSLVGIEDLSRPTPCDDWDLRALLSHVADVGDALLTLAATGTLDLTPEDRPAEEVAGAVLGRAERLRLQLVELADQPDSSDDQIGWATNAATSGAVEFAVHGWDVFAAIGQRNDIPATLAAALLTITSQAIPDAARGVQFAPALSVPGSSGASDRLMCFLGRPVNV